MEKFISFQHYETPWEIREWKGGERKIYMYSPGCIANGLRPPNGTVLRIRPQKLKVAYNVLIFCMIQIEMVFWIFLMICLEIGCTCTAYEDIQFIHDLEHSEHSHWNGSKFEKLGFNQFCKKQILYIKQIVRFQYRVVTRAQYPIYR